MSSKNKLFRMVLAAMFLAIALLLPFLTGQIPKIGSSLCPMHLPVILCSFFCGPGYAAIIGFIAPLLRFLLFGMPPVFPTGIAMCFELATYGLAAGLLYGMLPKRKPYVYVSLIGAMILGRLVWGTVKMILYSFGKTEFGWAAFTAGAFFDAIPGIILQIIVVPILVIALEKYTYGNKTVN